jgi:hypothetical protein
VYEKTTGTYLDLYINELPIATTVLCLDRTPIPIEPYKNFIGSLMFVDVQGSNNPTADDFGTRYLLQWLS